MRRGAGRRRPPEATVPFRHELGHVDPLDAVQRGQKLRPVVVAHVQDGVHQRVHHFLALADDDGVEEGGHRLRVHGDARPAGDQQRPALVAVGRQRRQAGLAQHLHHVEVVHLVGDGEGPDRELVHPLLGLQRQQRPPGLPAALVPETRSQTTSGRWLKRR